MKIIVGATLVVARVVVGTPGYMDPEQYLAGVLDAHTDQYSFCVTLYEALFQTRPYLARKFNTLKRKVLAGTPDPLPTGVKVPTRLRRITMRGLSVAKADRFPDMDALLAELAKDPRVLRRRIAGALAVFVLLQASLSRFF